jgi:hypothetical protein
MLHERHIAREQLHRLISSFGKQRVLVIGDMVADEYLIGRPTRIAREAPVLILELASIFLFAYNLELKMRVSRAASAVNEILAAHGIASIL